ncbi:DUF3718 domain-containing protein [Thalassomonas viridans]|uniref:DUF3718 domain-containing protein n=1 Tax=Thalassomonas viridans TaxID=137584 RepID=A0AAF0CAT3_9GAMM|nr:DUF3718 domain-containing protein [Thalassomonas viridans]WDE06886.1 DUF3718 domain-containing protein [Thalassomonas viridans]
MKNILLVTSLLAASVSFAPQASANDSISLRVCEYVSVNDKRRLRSFLKDRKLKIRSIFDGLQCNGQNLLEFAAASNALDTGELIINKLPVKTVAANLDVIKKHSAHLGGVAEARVK